jgi:hypothetical protein
VSCLSARTAAVCALSLASSICAQACPNGQFENHGIFFGNCLPDIGGKNSVTNNSGQITGGPNSVIYNPGHITQGVANALNELQASVLTGPTLERAIVASRNAAISGSMPIPPGVRRAMTGYISEDSLNRAKYKIGDNGFINLAHLLEQGGRADAVTAHQLTHVGQYAAWGVHSFAVQYVRNWHSVEDPAYAKGDGFYAWYNQQTNMPPATMPTK